MSKARLIILVAIWLAMGAGSALGAEAALDAAAFNADTEALARLPHRLAGYGREEGAPAGSYRASVYVESRLREMDFGTGDDGLFIQEFPVPQPTTRECILTIAGQDYLQADGFLPMRPNFLQGVASPAEGLTGQAVYAGNGRMDQYTSPDVKDKIVLLEYDCGNEWRKAFALGARAVVFLGQAYQSGAPAVKPFHHINLPANLPRFYLTPALAESLKIREFDSELTIRASTQWSQRRGRNVIAMIQGTDAKFLPDRPDQAIVLAAPLDSLSEVLTSSPAARDAANVAALLQLADHFRQNRPRRDLILCFLDAQSISHLGARAFYGSLMRQEKIFKANSLEQIREMLQEERLFHDKILDVLAAPDLFSLQAKAFGRVHQEAIRRLTAEARNFDSEILDELQPLRVRRAELERDRVLAERTRSQAEAAGAEAVAELDASLEAMRLEIERIDVLVGTVGESGLAKEDMDWNQVERFLYEKSTVAEARAAFEADKSKAGEAALGQWTSVEKKIPRLTERYGEMTRTRIAEIDQELQEVAQGMALRDAMGSENEWIVLHISLNLGDAHDRWTFIHGDDSAPLNQDKAGNYTGIYSTIQKIHGQINGYGLLSSKEILIWTDLCKGLVAAGEGSPDTPGARLWALLGEELQQRLIDSAAAETVSEASKSKIIRSLNGVLSEPGFGRASDFAKGRLSAQDRALLELPVAGRSQEDTHRLNRLLLERIVPGTLTESPSVRQAPHFDARAISGLYDMHHFAPGSFIDSGPVARMFSIFNISVMTAMDPLSRQGHPFDDLDALNADMVLAQAAEASRFFEALADHTELSVSTSIRPDAWYHDIEWSNGRCHGGSVKRAGGGSAMADRPVPDAFVAVIRGGAGGSWTGLRVEKSPPGFFQPILVKTNMHGSFGTPPAARTDYKSTNFFAVMFDRDKLVPDPNTGRQRTKTARGLPDFVISQLSYPATREAAADFTRAALSLFKTRSKSIIGYGYDRGAIATTVMRAASTAKFRTDRSLLCEVGNLMALFAPYDAKGFKLFNKAGVVLLNNSKDAFVGRGISLIDPFDHPVTPEVTAHDLLVLNEGRLNLLRKNRINQESLEILHSKAVGLLEDAGSQTSASAANGYRAAAAATARRPYIPLVGVMNDLVTAVVLLLLLAMPFAYSLERLLIGTPHIYRQIGWFTILFVVTFVVLYFVNPAFSIAATPIIIFLAFGIILLSSMVIFIMTRKLQTEIKKMQGLSATVHSADVSRLSTMMAAVHMGISTMRRRPLRTLLTAATVVLLTFTILTFASFGTSWGLRATYEQPLNGAPRVVVRHQLWNPIGEGVFDGLAGYLTEECEVVPRYWVSPTATEIKDALLTDENFERLVSSARGDQIAPMAAAIGIDQRDLEHQRELRQLLDGRVELLDSNGIFLTQAVRDELKLTSADIGQVKVLYAGQEFTFAGTIRDELAGFTMLEGSSPLPVDYHSSAGGSVEEFTQDSASTNQTLSEMPDIESAQFVTYNLHMNVIIPADIARRMGGTIRSISLYPENIESIRELAERAARISELPTYVGDSQGVYRLIFTSLATASGWRDLLIPVALGGLIIFATMLGSVSDREQEIYTFSSLGLAPPHVASLFFAEASVYAVIGGMGGYLLGQIVARILGFLAGLGYVSVPTMNYSSTNAIVTILIVMCTVLISTIYPAAKASRSANPGIQRSWRIPPPEGNLYNLIFPFTVSAYDITGVVSFLQEHFENYSDTSLGVFATTHSHIFRQTDNDMLGLQATVALAPFDLGVTQKFALLSQPSEIPGIDEVQIYIYRLSGARGDWQRANRVFINELRKQLLIWRSITPEIMDRYRETTLAAWEKLPQERVDGNTIAGDQA